MLQLCEAMEYHGEYFLIQITGTDWDGKKLIVTLHPEDSVITAKAEFPLQIVSPEPLYFCAAGVAVILCYQSERYLLLVQRNPEATIYPGALSTFIGTSGNLVECLDPILTMRRELGEELLIVSPDKKICWDLVGFFSDSNLPKDLDPGQRLKRMGVETDPFRRLQYSPRPFPNQILIRHEGILHESSGYVFIDPETSRVNILGIWEVKLPFSLEHFTFFDGEEDSKGNFLHRRIFVCNLAEFRNWWSNRNHSYHLPISNVFPYLCSFQKGERSGEGEISNPTFSPVFASIAGYL